MSIQNCDRNTAEVNNPAARGVLRLEYRSRRKARQTQTQKLLSLYVMILTLPRRIAS